MKGEDIQKVWVDEQRWREGEGRLMANSATTISGTRSVDPKVLGVDTGEAILWIFG